LRTYVIQRLAITWLVLFFDSYDKTAQTALGMLFCVNVGAGPYPRRWVLDVRLPCPKYLSDDWQRAAVAVGILLLLVCICFPMLLARWLATSVYKGIITSEGRTEVQAFTEGRMFHYGCLSSRVRGFMRHSLRDVLRFRYADYNTQYELLRKPAADAGELSAHNRGVSSGSEPTGCIMRVLRWLRHLSLHRMRLWAVLCWDSILDLHRLLLALAALGVMMHELHQVLLVVLVFSSYLVLILAARPHKCTTIWRLQVSALLVLLLSCFGIIACNIGDTSGFYEERIQRDYRDAVPWVVVSLNAAYLVFAGCMLLRSVWHKCRREGCATAMCVPRCSTRAPPVAADCSNT
jgi:hypothetical protein